LGLEIATLTDFFLLFAVMAGVASVLLFLLCPLLKKMMKGVE
jgi:POT family proton-dependent oligopeptide transporter